MARFKNINGVRTQFTEAEETARDEEETQIAAEVKTRTDAATAAAVKKASGKQKLKDLGLDDAEIKALTGA